MPDKGLFGFVAVFGFALVIALKLYNFNSDLVAGSAVALMVAYGLIAYRIPDVQIRLDRLGDNFYYLGFIFTLASMSAALIQLRAEPNIEAILGSFGIALITTIVGVAGRVLFTQMRTEIDEVEAAIRRDIIQVSNDLRAQLSLSLRDFETFHRSVQQVADEGLARSEAAIDKQISQVGNATRLVAEQIEAAAASVARCEGVIVSQVGTAARSAAEQITDAFKTHQTHAKAIKDTISEITEAVDKLTKRLATMELPTERIDKQVGSVAAELERVVKRVVASLEEMAQRLNAIQLPTERIEKQIESFGAELERRLLARLAAVVEEVEKTPRARRPWRFR